MCYNANVSGGTFLFVAIAAAFMWYRNRDIDRPLALMLLFIAVMQLLEWGLWLNLDCNTVNKVISAIIPIYLMLQPVVLNWIVGSYKAGWGIGYGTVAAVAAALLIPYQFFNIKSFYGDCSKINKNGHLAWPGFPYHNIISLIYYAAIVYPFATLKHTGFAALYLLFAGASLYMFYDADKSGWPSLWCHFANLLALFAVLRPT